MIITMKIIIVLLYLFATFLVAKNIITDCDIFGMLAIIIHFCNVILYIAVLIEGNDRNNKII